MKKHLLIVLFLQAFISVEISAKIRKPFTFDSTVKQNSIVFYVNQPMGLKQKVRVKLGYKNEHDETFLVSYADYHYNSFLPFFGDYNIKGFQGCFEYQKCTIKGKKVNYSYFGKIGYGEFQSSTKTDFFSVPSISSGDARGSYLLIGGGIAQEFYLDIKNRFSFQISEGLKYCQTLDVKGNHQPADFNFIFSPGSILDINFNLGYKF